MLPSACEMPSLQDVCKPLVPRYLLQVVFLGVNHVDESTSLLLRVIVRLVDKALYEYGAARVAIENQIREQDRSVKEMEKGRLIYMFGFVNHMENCINACGRVLKLIERAQSHPNVGSLASIQAALSHAVSKELTDTRNTVEHMDERITSGQLKGGAIALVLSDDSRSVEIGTHSIELSSLASLIQALHEATQSAIWPKSAA